ncbi:endonuclease [Yeosuana marina]|uniref:endonuclease n=1 Tax=Yeosuana marina TaxID=1565536 RepID=UPI0030C848DB
MKKNYLKKSFFVRVLALLSLTFSYAQVPSYYNGTDITVTGASLKANLATLVTDTQTTILTYTPGVWDALKQTDLDPTNPNNVLLIYGSDDSDSDITNDRTRSKDLNGGNVGDWNREHTYAKSLGDPNLGETGPGSDAHHLRASDVQLNAIRSNRLYTDGSGNAKVVNTGFYPGDEWKGDVARMMMYMYIRYGDRCLPSNVGLGSSTYSPEMRDIFLEWNAEDPVSQVEINRNVILEGIQGNRNPFIDNPAFATSIWGGPQAENRFENTSTDIEAPSIPANLVASNITATTTDLSWNTSTDNVGVIAYQIFNEETQIGTSTTTTYTVAGLTSSTAYAFTVKAIDAASNVSAASNTVSITTLEDVVTPPTGDFIAFQGYEGSANDTWAYMQSPVPCNNGGDVWQVVSSVGSIAAPKTGNSFFGVQDLEGNCGTADGGTLSFDAIDITGYQDVVLSFGVNIVGFDVANGDVVTYELFYDDVSQGVTTITVGSPYSTVDWEQISQAIPNTVSRVGLQLYVKQNGGSDYAGFDDVKLEGTAITTGTPSIVINEVDADQPSTDAAEFIELYDGGVGNSSLDGFVVVLFNGDNNDLSYKTIDLNGYTTDENGYFVIGSANVPNVDLAIFTTNGIQNGADAVALYKGDADSFPNNTVVLVDDTLVDALVYGTSDADDAGLLALLNALEPQVDENEGGNGTTNSMQRIPNGQGGARNTSGYAMLVPTPGTENILGGTTDTEAPSVPTNLAAQNIAATTTDLSWDAATDNVAVTEYQIFDGATLLGSTTNTSFTVEGLTGETNYMLTVVALDAAGNTSATTATISFTTTKETTVSGSALIITGIADGPLTGGIPKAIELYVTQDIADLSVYGFGSANNGGGTDGEEFTFPAESASKGDFIYIATEVPGFTSFFGFAPNYTSGAAAINGDDAIELFKDGVVVDVFGDINTDGSGQAWDYLDGWVYRNENTGPDGSTFILDNWSFSGINALDNETTNATAVNPFPTATYKMSEPAQIIINEVDSDNPGTDALEFIELYDGGSGNTSLDGLVVVLYNGSNDLSYNAIDLDGYSTNANGYFVIGSAGVTNVDLVSFTTNGIQNGPDAVALYKGDATSFPNNTPILVDELLLDALVYDTDDSDDTELLALLNTGEPQVNEAGMGDKDNQSMQRIPNGSGGARNTVTYTQTIPSPGTENGAVIPPPAVISILDARNTADGELVTVSGVLTVSDQFAGSAYLQDKTAAIAIFDEAVHGEGNFKIGDSITVTGTRSAFNDQIQISGVTNVENNGLPNNPITPVTITLAEMGNHPSELVNILNPAFPKPGDILFGNSNYVLSDASGQGELRIDNDVDDLVGLGQPESCDGIVGVVGRFYETYQLLPRMKSDMPCAGDYVPLGSSIPVTKDKTFDVVAWNIEWFGDETNSPTAGNPLSDDIQKESVKAVLQKLDADVYAVEEVSDDTLFAQLVSEMPGYAYVLSDAVSYPNDETGTQQKVGFIYNANTVSVEGTKVLLKSIHPYYNGGDESALTDYPVADKTRFYASGRLPFMMTANVTLNGESKQFNIVSLHARANSGTESQERYDMRKYDVEVLKDTLDVQYPDANLIILGDYNDDVDETVADNVSTTISTYEKYVNDFANYNIVTSALSAEDYRSYVFRENMIDHIMVSNEVTPIYIEGSVSVGYEFYNSNYTSTTSDHFPVSARFLINELKLHDITAINVTCAGEQNGSATVSVSGGIAPYNYLWSDGQTSTTAVGLGGGTYSVIVTDALGKEVTGEVVVEEPTPLEITKTDDTTVYYGYAPESCATIAISDVLGGVAPYSYLWSTDETTNAITVCPEETTTYSVTVTDANGCALDAEIVVNVVDVQCGNNERHPKVEMCHNGRSICVSERAVQAHLNHGDVLGSCDTVNDNNDDITYRIYPNPFKAFVAVKLENTNVNSKIKILVYNHYGRLVYKSQEGFFCQKDKLVLPLWYLRRGYYYLKVYVDGELQGTETLIKE